MGRPLRVHEIPLRDCVAAIQMPRDVTQEEAIKIARVAMALANMDPESFPLAPTPPAETPTGQR